MTVGDLPMRMASVLIVIALSGFYLPFDLVVTTLVAYVVIELWGFWAAKSILAGITWWNYLNLLAGACLGSAVFLRIPYEMWHIGGFAAQMFGFCVLMTSLIHCATVRVYHLPLAVVTGLPVVIVIGLTLVESLMHQSSVVDVLVSFAVLLLMVCYITMMMIDGAKARRVLIEARDAADAANQAKGRFLTSMSHEIRTPLNGILGIAQLMKEDAITAEERQRSEVLVGSAIALKTLVDDVLDHAKVEAGKLSLKPVEADIRQLTADVLRLFQTNADEKGLWLRQHLDADIPEKMIFDPIRLRQVLSNLVSNAIKFTDRGGIDIHTSVSCDAGQGFCVQIAVRDTGVGIAPAAQDQLFKTFSQVDDHDDRAASGTGLGLAISLGLAQLMDGKIALESELGEGAKFILTFFAGRVDVEDSMQNEDQDRAGESPLNLQGRRILLVDDNMSNRFIVRAYLKSTGIMIMEAENGAVALNLAAEHCFDLILMDMHMPVMNGRAATRKIRATTQNATVPIIALTADSAPEDRDKYLGLGMDGYLAKPLTKSDLIEELHRFFPMPIVQSTAAE